MPLKLFRYFLYLEHTTQTQPQTGNTMFGFTIKVFELDCNDYYHIESDFGYKARSLAKTAMMQRLRHMQKNRTPLNMSDIYKAELLECTVLETEVVKPR